MNSTCFDFLKVINQKFVKYNLDFWYVIKILIYYIDLVIWEPLLPQILQANPPPSCLKRDVICKRPYHEHYANPCHIDSTLCNYWEIGLWWESNSCPHKGDGYRFLVCYQTIRSYIYDTTPYLNGTEKN